MTGVFLYTNDNIYEEGFKSRTYYLKQKLIPIDYKQDVSIINKQIDEINPDYIFSFFHNDYDKLEGIAKNNIPLVIEMDDFWKRLFSNEFNDIKKKIGLKGISVHSRCAILPFRDYFGESDTDIFWFKWGVDTNIMKDYKLPKINDVYFSGKYSRYNSRLSIISILDKDKSIRFVNIVPYPKSNLPYEKYAMNINRNYIALGGCIQNFDLSYYKGMFIGNTFMRNIEIPACGTCLLNTPFGDMKILGFKDGVNCIIPEYYEEVLSKVKYYLDDKELLAKITKNGYDLVHSKYSNEQVVDEFVKELEVAYA